MYGVIVIKMSNTIKAQVCFSFRGENYSPELIINLDELMAAGQDFSRLYEQLAQANGIDSYSYAFEVMASCDIEFSDATGDAVNYLQESGAFDLEGFRKQWKTKHSNSQLLAIAREHLNINSLDEIEGLAAALQAAFDAGASKK